MVLVLQLQRALLKLVQQSCLTILSRNWLIKVWLLTKNWGLMRTDMYVT